jgi:pSer/pThr/pTyr-binding forkhead associated (FHA) protein
MSRRAARLEVIAGKAVGTSIPVEDELLLGRQFDGPGMLAEDDEISRRHARIAFADASGQFTIEDLGSTNGTFVNATRVSAPQPLAVGDTIEVGGTTLLVRELPSQGEETVVRPADRSTAAPGVQSQVSEQHERSAQSTTPSLTVPAFDERLPSKAPTVSDEPASELTGAASAEQPAPIAPPVSVSLHLEVDFDARSAKITLGDGDDAMSMVFEEGAWRLAQGSA